MQSITFSSRMSAPKVCHPNIILSIIQHNRRFPRPSIIRHPSSTIISFYDYYRSHLQRRITKYLRQRLHRYNRMVRTIPKTGPPRPPLDPLPNSRTLLRRRPQRLHTRHGRTRPRNLSYILSPPSPQRRSRKSHASRRRSRRWSSYPWCPYPPTKPIRSDVD